MKKVLLASLIVLVCGVSIVLAQVKYQDIKGSDFKSAVFWSDIDAAVTATGTDQSGAAGLANTYNVVTGGTVTSDDGVRLPSAQAGRIVIIAAEYGDVLAVWPATGDSIDDAGANAETAQADNSLAFYVAQDGTVWRKLEN